MENSLFDNEVGLSLDILKRGGVILYPTDTIWGIGCDATSESAIRRIYEIKKRPDHKSLIILVAEDTDKDPYAFRGGVSEKLWPP